MSKNIVSVDWVKENLNQPGLHIVDCRYELADPRAGRMAYDEGHIPGAHFFDMKKDLSGPVQEHGGRHPLPDIEQFVARLEQVGIDNQSTVVVYDDQAGGMASRLWWLLKYVGHDKVFLMDEGFSKWKAKGYPVTREVPGELPASARKSYTVNLQQKMLASMEEVRNSLGKEGIVLIDAREEKRYLGVEEPIDPIAGHIPGAINHFWKDGLNEDGSWKSIEEQKRRFQDMDPEAEIIVYCGSGISACPNVIALQEAGFTKVKLYAGSWSDWITYPDNPIAKKK